MTPAKNDLEYRDYPFRRHWLTHAHGARQHYLDEGRGDPVLMVHGNPTWSYYWRHLVHELARDHRCIVPDHVGMGLSDRPRDAQYRYQLEQRIDDLDALLAHLGSPGRITLVVHDWGGAIGLGWACRHPARVARLVVTNTAAFPMPAAKTLPWLLRLGRDSRIGAWLIEDHNAFARGALCLALRRRRLSADEARAYTAPYAGPGDSLATLRFVQDIPLGPADRGYALLEDMARMLPRFAGLPILLAWGLRDFVFDHHFLDTFRRVWPAAEVHTEAAAGHYVLEDARTTLIPAIRRFIDAHPLR